MRVFIPHVNHRCADFNASRFGASGREQWERGRQLPRKMMNAKVRSVRSQALGFDCEIHRL
jgi:hypothetical protein